MKEDVFKKFKNLALFAYGSALALWTILMTLQVVDLACEKNLSINSATKRVCLNDWVGSYVAGQIALSAEREGAFTLDVQRKYYYRLIGHDYLVRCDKDVVSSLYNQSLPITFLLMIPFSKMPLDQAQLFFEFLTTTFGLLSFLFLAASLSYLRMPTIALLCLGLTGSEIAWHNWREGQIMWLYLGLSCLYLAATLRNKSPNVGGLSLSLMVIKPQYLLFFLPISIAFRRYRLLAYAFVFGSMMVIACFCVFGGQVIDNYTHALHQCEISSSMVWSQFMNCVRAELSLFFTPDLSYRLAVALFLMVALTVCAGTFSQIRNIAASRTVLTWSLASTIIAALLFSPHCHKQDLILLIIPALFIFTSETLNNLALPGKIVCIIYWTLPIASWLFYFSGMLCPNAIYAGHHLWIGVLAVMLFASVLELKRAVSAIEEGSQLPVRKNGQ